MPDIRHFMILLLAAFVLILAGPALGRSAFSPRHTGLEPPGGPRNLDMGGRSIMRTPMGGMGYTDAYGNTLDDQAPEEKKVSKRRPARKKAVPPRPLPDPENSRPVWSFN